MIRQKSVPLQHNHKLNSKMDFNVFLHETPLWLLLIFGASYALILGGTIWLLVRLFQPKRN